MFECFIDFNFQQMPFGGFLRNIIDTDTTQGSQKLGTIVLIAAVTNGLASIKYRGETRVSLQGGQVV